MFDVLVSIVSHNQASYVNNLLRDLDKYCPYVKVIITSNIEEDEPIDLNAHPSSIYIKNKFPKGFSSNHNSAFMFSEGSYFCVVNPDIKLRADPFPNLISAMTENRIGVISPLVYSIIGTLEDNARSFPTVFNLVKRLFGFREDNVATYCDVPVPVDWVAGMFMFFRSQAFTDIGGFDDDFFLYYEDVDICFRLQRQQWKVFVDPRVGIVHQAQRDSHWNIKYMRWHLMSMARYFIKHKLCYARQD